MHTLVTFTTDTTHYGIPVSDIGEDGDLIAPGHHPTRHALAAFNRHARTIWGLPNIADWSPNAGPLYDRIHHHWGIFRTPDPDNPAEDPAWEWVLDNTGPDTPGAVPYTRIHL